MAKDKELTLYVTDHKGKAIEGQDVTGTATVLSGKSKETVDLSFDWKDITLEQLPVKAKLPEAELKGLVDGEMDLRLRVQGNSLIPSEGKLTARLTGGSVKGPPTPTNSRRSWKAARTFRSAMGATTIMAISPLLVATSSTPPGKSWRIKAPA